jgi:porphobilinogen synthase
MIYRPRRLRANQTLRQLVQETNLSASDFVFPLFLVEGNGKKETIDSMPGIFRFSIDQLENEIKEIASLKIPGVILFGTTSHKDEVASSAYADNNLVAQAIRTIKKTAPQLTVMTDVCVCSYTPHGHCGVIKNQEVDNDATLEILAKMALSHAKAGADVVGPSAMMDGQVAAIRKMLDEYDFTNTSIMAYAAKYQSAFYGPFREAADSSPQFGNRASYQMHIANSREAIREMQLDADEGADILMVKPALPYLDVIAKAKEKFMLPIAAYNVSGEFSMLKAATQNGWLDGEKAMMEMLMAIKRAGAKIIITYFAKEAAQILNK